MGKLIEIDEFTEEVYQLEVTDFVEGGENGVDNKPHNALANRTMWLKSRIDAFLAGIGLTKAMVGLSNADNTSDLEKPISTAMQEILDSLVGQVAFFAMETAPSGWIKANGATISRITYAALFAKIGTIFGVGDGSTTFQLPDLRGEFIRGWDNSRGVDTSRIFGSQQIATQIQMDNDGNEVIGAMSVSQNNLSSHGFEPPQLNFTNIHFATASITSMVVNQHFLASVRPRNIAMLACIKY